MHKTGRNLDGCQSYRQAQECREIGIQLPDKLKKFERGEILPAVLPAFRPKHQNDYAVRDEDRQYLIDHGKPFKWRDSDPDAKTVDRWIEEILQPRKFAGKCLRWRHQRKKAMAELAKLRPIKFT